MRYSVIDISSSGISYIVADAADDGSSSAEIILKDRIYLGLSFFMDGNILTDEGIDKLCDCLKTARDTCARIGVRRCVVVSTASLRNITNSEEAESEIMRRLGLYVNYIDGETEAYCDYVANVFYAGMDSPVLVDVGGKSIEICDLSKSDKDEMTCLEFGLLDLRGRFVAGDNPTPDESEDIKKFTRYKFDDAGLPHEGVYRTAVLVGATCGAIYDVYQAFSKKQPKSGPKVMDRKTFKKMVKFLISDSGRSSLMLSVAPERLALIIPACIVLRNLFKRFDVDTIIVSDRGVKEGYLSMLLGGAGEIMVNELGGDAGGTADTEDVAVDDAAGEPGSGEDAAAFTEDVSEDACIEDEETVAADEYTHDDAEETAAVAVDEDAAVFTEEASEDGAGAVSAEAGESPSETEDARPETETHTPVDGALESTASGQESAPAVKRGRGRPRKNPDDVVVKTGTGKRGRPRKYPLAEDKAGDVTSGQSPVGPWSEDETRTAADVRLSAAGENGIASPDGYAYPGMPDGVGDVSSYDAGVYARDEENAATYGFETEDDGRDDARDDTAYVSEEESSEYGVATSESVDDAAGRKDGSVQVTIDELAWSDADGYESEEEFENELDEPVGTYVDAAGVISEPEREPVSAAEVESVSAGGDGEPVDASDGAEEEGSLPEGESPEPVSAGPEEPAADETAAAEAETGKKPAEKAVRGRAPAGTAKKPAGRKPAEEKRTVRKTAASQVETPVEPAEAPVVPLDMPAAPAEEPAALAAPVEMAGPGEESLSENIPERNVAPYVDVYEDTTDESGAFSDFEPLDAGPDVPGEDVAESAVTDGGENLGLSGMDDMDEGFSAFYREKGVADYVDDDEDKDV